jgi:bifunctional UDP-N-acetylglucosamine pyrophosphorylase/glucosamine-1-phosphate N-acetyltransferase
MPPDSQPIKQALGDLSSHIQDGPGRLGIVLAAGHGKRIRSETSKMLHLIWERPTVARVSESVDAGLASLDQVIVVGVGGLAVARTLGPRSGRVFAYQEGPVLGLPGGTGDAVRVALDSFSPPTQGERHIYVFPGDMGLLTGDLVKSFRRDFEENPCSMMILTGVYDGPPEQNYYGRIVRVPDTDVEGRPSGDDAGNVIAIREHRDILGLPDGGAEQLTYRGRDYSFTRQQLMETQEINTLIVAFRERDLRAHLGAMVADNAQGELLLTDLAEIYNRQGLTVRAVRTANEEEIIGFNVKSVWRQMESIAMRRAHKRLMDIITIVDEEDFFIADEVIEQIIAIDKDFGPLDIVVGKGAYIGPGVKLNRKLHLGDRCRITGGIVFGEGVRIGEGGQLSTYPGQTMHLEGGVEVLPRNILKGNMRIGERSRVESGVIMTGSDEWPMRVGKGVTIKGTSYLYGCHVDDGLLVEHSVIKCKHVQAVKRRDGTCQPVRYVVPTPEGLDSIGELPA